MIGIGVFVWVCAVAILGWGAFIFAMRGYDDALKGWDEAIQLCSKTLKLLEKVRRDCDDC